MRKCVLVLLFLLTLVACTKLTWKPYSYPDAGFTVLSPVAPRVEKRPGAITKYIMDLPDGSSFVISRSQMEKPVAPEEAESILKTLSTAVATGVHGEIVSQKDIRLGTIPGKALLVKNGDLEISIRCYASGTNLYALIAKGSPVPSGTEQFFNSFKVL